MNKIILPQPDTKGTIPLETCIAKRRSIRKYTKDPLTIGQLSQLCWSAQGITEPTRGLRAVPSGGAAFPATLYLVTPDGVFNYIPAEHALQQTADSDLRHALREACLGQAFIDIAPLNVIIGMVPSKITGKYGERGLRYMILEAGHIAQDLHLQAVALGLGSVAVGAYSDEKVKQAVGLPDDVEPVYIVTIGKAGG